MPTQLRGMELLDKVSASRESGRSLDDALKSVGVTKSKFLYWKTKLRNKSIRRALSPAMSTDAAPVQEKKRKVTMLTGSPEDIAEVIRRSEFN